LKTWRRHGGLTLEMTDGVGCHLIDHVFVPIE
jgi:hypothetical protein